MAAVASELEAAVPTITTTTAATDDGGPPEQSPVGSGHLKFPSEPNGLVEFGPCRKLEDHEEGRHDRPESEPEAGRGPESGVLVDHTELQVDRMNLSDFPVEWSGSDRVTPGLPADSESGGSYRTILPDSQHSAVFLHSLPDPPPGTEAGLSLAEPAEPTTNVTTDRAEAAERDRVYMGLMQADLGPGPAEDSVCDGAAERPEPGTGCRENSARKEEPAVQVMLDSSSNSIGPEPTSVLDLSPGSEVRVCLDHVIDDALVVSFRVGEQVFSGVLMDVSKRFGPYGIPITTFPRRDERSQPPASLLPVVIDNETSTKEEEVSSAPLSPTSSQHWSSRPPPLFQEGAPYPPPLFIRDTYNQALPQPPPRKIRRPKRRYRCEEPTSIMNAIKLRPRQVLCDKCKGVVVSGGYREARRGPVELRSNEVLRRRRAADLPISTELKRLRGDDRGGRSTPERRSSTGMPVSSSSSSSRRILRGMTSSSTASSSQEHSKLNSKKVLSKSSAADRSKSRQVLQKLVPHHLPTHQEKNQNRSKAVTRAASLQNHNQKVHFTRRLQHLSSSTAGAHVPLPPRMRLKPQRYRTDEPASQPASASPPKPATSTTHTPPPSAAAPPPPSTVSVAIETPEDERAGQGNDWQEVEPPPPSSFSSLDSSHSECSSTETFDLAPSGDLHSYSSDPAPLPPSPPSSSSLSPHCPASSYPAQLTANGENEEEGGDVKRRRKLSSSSSTSSSSSIFSKSVSKCLLPDGRTVCVGDIVWAKIYGFPWWPARVLGITVARRGDTGLAVRQEARVSWFGSPTTSFLPLPQLSPFLETFQSRFDKKRKGPYRRAIAEAASAAKQLTPEVRALLTQFET